MTDKNIHGDELSKQNVELENYFRNTIIPQLFIDANLIIRKFTPPAMKQFDLSTGDVGRSIRDIHENFRYLNIIDDIELVIGNNEILEKEIQTTDHRWYQMNIIPYMQENKRTNGVIITFVEITTRINDLKTQEKLIADYELLLDTISHDIKNPLNNLMLAVDLFKTAPETSPAESRSLLDIVDNALRKVQHILSELTDTRKQAYKYKSEEVLLNFENILEEVRLTLSENIRNAGAVIKKEIGASELFFSRRKLRSLVYNLVNNAIKFARPGTIPQIIIKTQKDKEFFILSVKDNGIGISADKQTAIFERYFRLENAIEGSGLGLYLVKEIVNQSGGRIEVKSELGQGSAFIVYLKNDAGVSI
jgi:two-component system, OmpR family, phosphate regulon sensor histidine kinase PhoR